MLGMVVRHKGIHIISRKLVVVRGRTRVSSIVRIQRDRRTSIRIISNTYQSIKDQQVEPKFTLI